MDTGKLTVEYRKNTGKNESRRLRASGRVPGICYGNGTTPTPIHLEARELKRALDPEKRQNTVINLTVNGGEGGPQQLTVMLKHYDVDAIRRDVEHVDLVVIDVNKEVTVEVPVVLTGKAVGIVEGGQLHTVHRSIAVSCKPADIPVKIVADISPLKIGDVLHVSDIQLPSGVKAALPPTEAVASIVAPQKEKTAAEEAAEAAAAEGAAPAAGAAAAAPAAGDKAAAPAAAAAGAKAEAKPAKEAKK
jgi:large subunit ribosomal protein L25